MRIRKRTPARAASPGPQPPPQPTLFLVQEKPQEQDRDAEEEKRAILAAGVRNGGRDDDRVPSAAANSSGNSSAADDVQKPEPQDAAAAVRCSRNDGKRWRCKKEAVPGYLFCDRHIAWSTRKRKPRAKANSKHTSRHGRGVLEPTTLAKGLELVQDHQTPSRLEHRSAGFFDGF